MNVCIRARHLGLVSVLGSMLLSANAHAVKLEYAHEYADRSKKQKDITAISHSFDSGLGIKAKYKFLPREKANGDAGTAFDNDKLDEREYELKYGIKMMPGWKLEPKMKYVIKDKEKKYKPELKVERTLVKGTKVGVGYEYYLKEKKGKPHQHTHEFKAMMEQKLGAWELSYEYTHYTANQALYNHHHSDYEHDLELAYNINKHWSPSVEVKNVSVDADSSKRESEFYAGVTYAF